jgi:hypothetical protein
MALRMSFFGDGSTFMASNMACEDPCAGLILHMCNHVADEQPESSLDQENCYEATSCAILDNSPK